MKKTVKTPLTVGNNVFIRTITNYYTGKIVEISKESVTLEQVAWIADTGRFADALKSGKFGEVEPYPEGSLVTVMLGAIVDLSIWAHDLPRTQV